MKRDAIFDASTAPQGAVLVSGGWSLRGAKKGGGSARQPIEATDSLHSTSYARVLDLLSEGEISGLVNGLQSIYLNNTPLQNADGSLNFTGVQVDVRTGTQYQDPVPGFPASESTQSVGVPLKASTAWTHAVSNTQLSAVRVTLGVQGLSQTDLTNGDMSGYRVEYAIELATDGGAFAQVLAGAFDGKTRNTYTRTHRIDLPRAASGWTVRVRRTTPDSTSSAVSDSTFVESVTDVIDGRLRHPMSALVGVSLDAAQFNAVPARAYHARGRIIRVPSNYDAAARIYTGVWDGTFQLAYSNNPAWVFFDIVGNDRYGLGRRIPAGWLDKWALYQIGQYCDEMVPNGRGGTESRFVCNAYLQQRADAYRVLQDLASVFRGMAYWASGAAVAVADMPRDPVYTYTAANVVDGRFTYTGAGLRTRYTVALVSWNDPSDMGRAKIEVVEDRDGIARYGLRQIEVTAFACSSQGQAQRMGKWLLLTSRMETRNVSFSVGLDGAIAAPGQVIRVADPTLAGRRIGGRIRAATATKVTVDAELGVRPGDRLTVILPSGVAQTRTVSDATGVALTVDGTTITVDSTELTADLVGLPGTVLHITVTQPYSATPEPEAVWTLESERLAAQTFRVVSVTEGEGLTFDINAVQHEAGKFDAVDHGTRIQRAPVSVIPPSVQPAPASVAISAFSVVAQGIASQSAVISWPTVDKAVAYEVEWRRNNSQWVKVPRTGSASVEIDNIYAGAYLARVRAVNALDIPSAWATSVETQLDGILAPPPVVTSLTAAGLVFGIRIDWGLPTGPSIIERTELWYSQTSDRAQAIKLGDFAYPQNTHTMMGLAAGAGFYFWARLVDKNGMQGDWHPAGAGVRGQASSSASDILAYLKDQITETQLAQALLERIDAAGDSQVQIDAITSALAAMYTIKTQLTVDGKPYMAGIGVGVENDQGVITSQILLAAQRIAVLNEANGATGVPFVIQNGQVFMNSAFIAQASIGSAKLANWLESDAVNSQGQRVLRMNMRTGEIQLNGSGAGGRMTLNSNVQKVYDANGVLRVQIGDLSA